MSSFFSFLPADGWQRLLCDALWQSTLISGLGWLMARFLVRQSAARAWLMLMTLIACAIVPLASMAARANGWTVLTAESDRTSLPLANAVTITSADVEQFVQKLSSQPIESDPSAAAVFTPTDDRPIDELNSDNISPAAARSSAAKSAVAVFLPVAAGQAAVRFTSAIVLQILGTIWFALSVLLLARLMLAIAAARHTMRNAMPCNDAALLSAAAEAARRIGMPCPAVFYSRHVETPTILAFRRSRLLVPPVEASLRDANTVALSTAAIATPDAAGSTSRLGESRPPIDWIAAFSHELAHVARGDGWSRLAVECIRIALPLQPLIWLLRRSFHTACEESCDDWAVATGSNPIDLADTLTAWINRPKRSVSLIAIGMSSTKSRTLRLLSLRKQPIAKLGSKWRLMGLPIAFGLIAALAMAQSPADRNDKKESPPATKRAEDDKTADKSELKHHDGTADGKKSLGGSGEMVQFTLPAAQKISGIRIHGSRYGLAKPPDEDFLIYLLGPHGSEVLNTQKAPYSLFERGKEKWVTVRFPKPIEAPKEFWIALDFRAEQTKGVYVSYDTSTGGKFSKIGLPGAKSRDVDFKGDWMIELLPEKPANEKSAAVLHHRTAPGDVADSLPPYVIEPPDILKITPVRLVSKGPVVIEPFDTVNINAENTKLDAPIAGKFKVDSSGVVVLGPSYGAVKISGLTRPEAQAAVKKQLEETLARPEVALTIDESSIEKGIGGEHLVGPDGTVNLGIYGQVSISGDTIEQARSAIQDQLNDFFVNPVVAVDVHAYNSKVYYVISQRDGVGDSIWRFPVNGNETVLDAVAQVRGLTGLSKAKIWIARPSPTGVDKILPVAWDEITQGGGSASTTYQVLPGDRIYISGLPSRPQNLPAPSNSRANQSGGAPKSEQY